MSFDRFARPRPFVTKEIFYVAWCDFGRACITCADDYRAGAAAAWQGCGGGSRIRFGCIGHRVWCAWHQHLVFEINGGVFGPLFSLPFLSWGYWLRVEPFNRRRGLEGAPKPPP